MKGMCTHTHTNTHKHTFTRPLKTEQLSKRQLKPQVLIRWKLLPVKTQRGGPGGGATWQPRVVNIEQTLTHACMHTHPLFLSHTHTHTHPPTPTHTHTHKQAGQSNISFLHEKIFFWTLVIPWFIKNHYFGLRGCVSHTLKPSKSWGCYILSGRYASVH